MIKLHRAATCVYIAKVRSVSSPTPPMPSLSGDYMESWILLLLLYHEQKVIVPNGKKVQVENEGQESTKIRKKKKNKLNYKHILQYMDSKS